MAFKMKAGKEGPMKKNFPSSFKLGPSSGFSGQQGREKDVKPGYVDVDGNPSERGRRNMTPASVGTNVFNMKSPKKAKAKKTGGGITVYNDQGQIHAKYAPGDVGYDQAKLMASNQASAMNMKSPKKMAKESPKKIVKTNTRKSTMKMKAKTGAKKDAMMDRKSAMAMKKESGMKMKKESGMKMAKKSSMKMAKKSANKMNPGFDKLPKDVQAKIMKNKK